MKGRTAREMAEEVDRARRRHERGDIGAVADGLRGLYHWWRRRSARVLVALLVLALGVVIGIAVFPLLPAETRDFVERLVGV